MTSHSPLTTRHYFLHYNPFVAGNLKKEDEARTRRPRDSRRDAGATARRARLRARVAETIGMALIALMILVITLVRYWRVIHWNWR